MSNENKNSVENYPRKQFRRENWATLNGEWMFTFDHDRKWNSPNEVTEWSLKIQVPFAPECPASGIGDQDFHNRCWYKRQFSFSKSNKHVLLNFGAVDYQARVWVNGHFVGAHEGGYTPFCFDITHVLSADSSQEIIVCVDDDPHDLTKPRGKQDWQRHPHSIWYPRTTGIWQTVWLEEVNRVHIDRIRCTPLLERWEIGLEAFINGPCNGSDLKLKVRLKTNDTLLAEDSYHVIHNEVHRKIALSDPGIDDFRNELLWSPEKPTLIDLVLELWQDGVLIDTIHSYTALRSVTVSRGRFLLNGRPYYMRLVLDQGYWPDTFMTPPSSESLKKDILLVKDAGFNGVRKHQKIEDPDFLYWADVLGLLVWTEMPSAYRFTHESVERLTREWTEIIDRDLNHPCVVVWVPFNESWGVPDLAEKAVHRNYVQAVYHLTKTLDATRPCIGNDGWENFATDILGVHDYDDIPNRLEKKYSSDGPTSEILKRYWPGGRMITVDGYEHAAQPIMLTEFGGIAYDDGTQKRDVKPWGYSKVQNSDDLKNRFQDLLSAVHRIELFSGFCYTQFTDTFQEANGLFRDDRSPKFSVRAMARAIRGQSNLRGELTSVPQPPPVPEGDEGPEVRA